jgi:hypothetical protein
MRDGRCFALVMHPWLMDGLAVQLLGRLVRDIQAAGDVWFARGREIAAWYLEHPEARREIDLDM